MTFVDTLMSFLSGALSFIGDAIDKLLSFLAVPLGWLIAFLEGIYYFFVALVEIVIAILNIFWSLFQFIGALFAGFFRTIRGLLFIDFSQTPVNYPSATGSGMSVVVDKILAPVGFLTVVPMILLAIIWLLFVMRVFALLGGDVTNDD